jgi:hypothetical protein
MARNLSGTGFTNIRTLNGTGGLSGVLNELQNLSGDNSGKLLIGKSSGSAMALANMTDGEAIEVQNGSGSIRLDLSMKKNTAVSTSLNDSDIFLFADNSTGKIVKYIRVDDLLSKYAYATITGDKSGYILIGNANGSMSLNTLTEGKAISRTLGDGTLVCDLNMKKNTTEATSLGDTDLFLIADTTGATIKYCTIANLKNEATWWTLNSVSLYPDSTSYNLLVGTTSNSGSHKLLVSGTAKITGNTTLSGTLTCGAYTSGTLTIKGTTNAELGGANTSVIKLQGQNGADLSAVDVITIVNKPEDDEDAFPEIQIKANGSLGSLGQYLRSDGNNCYWSTHTDILWSTITGGIKPTTTTDCVVLGHTARLLSDTILEVKGNSYHYGGNYNLFNVISTANGFNACNTDTTIAYGGYADFFERNATLTNGKASYRIRLYAPHDLDANKDIMMPKESGTMAILGLNTGAMTFADTDPIGWGWNGALANYIMKYDTDLLWYAKTGTAFSLIMASDNAEDNADKWNLKITDGGVYSLSNKISGSFEEYLKITPNATITSGAMLVGCEMQLMDDLYIADDKLIKIGTDNNYTIGYDEASTDRLQISNGIADTDFNMSLKTDLGADAGDIWNIKIPNTTSDLMFQSTIRSTSHYTTMFQITPTYDSTRDAGRPEFYIGSPAFGILTSGLPPLKEGSAWTGYSAISVATGTGTNETDNMLIGSNLYLSQTTSTPYLKFIQTCASALNQSGAGIYVGGNFLKFFTNDAGAVTKDATMSTTERMEITPDGYIVFNGIANIKNQLEVDDDKYIKFGDDMDYGLQYNTTSSHLRLVNLIDGGDFNFEWWADRGDAVYHKFSWYIPASGGYMSMNSLHAGSWSSAFAYVSSTDNTLENAWNKNLCVSPDRSGMGWGAIGLQSDMSTPTYATHQIRVRIQNYQTNKGFLHECKDGDNVYRCTSEFRTWYDSPCEIFLGTNGMPRWDISARDSGASYSLNFYSNETSSGTDSWRPTFGGASTNAFSISVNGTCTADNSFVPFTGAHDCKIDTDVNYEVGLVVDVIDSDVRVNHRYPNGDVSNTNFTCKLCDTSNSKSVLGVISQKTIPKSQSPDKNDGEVPAGTFMFNWSVNAVGEGSILITNFNGEIEKGDLIVSSEIAGYGMCQKTAKGKDDLVRNKTIAKCMKVINWANITDTITHNGFTYKKLLCPCIYMCG